VRDCVSGRGPGSGQDAASGDPHLRRIGRAETGIRNAGGESMSRAATLLFATAFSAGVILAQPPKKEEPVGLVLLPGGAKLIRAGVETPLAAKPGDILFSGDAMKTEAAPASFLYCPTKSSQALA